jgi:hypothetical protein
MDDREVEEAEAWAEPRGEAAAVEGVEASMSDSVMVRFSKDFLEAGRLEDVVAAIVQASSWATTWSNPGAKKGAVG